MQLNILTQDHQALFIYVTAQGLRLRVRNDELGSTVVLTTTGTTLTSAYEMPPQYELANFDIKASHVSEALVREIFYLIAASSDPNVITVDINLLISKVRQPAPANW